jgi:hypothetical protein
MQNMNSETTAGGKGGSIPAWAHVVCGWPLIMVAFGGAIGGGLGGAAYGVNVYICKSRLPIAVKVVLVPLTGLAAIALWALIASAIHSARR